MPHILFVGIDVSSKNNVVCCLPEGDSTKPLSRFTVANDEPGVFALRDRIVALMQKHDLTHIRFGLVPGRAEKRQGRRLVHRREAPIRSSTPCLHVERDPRCVATPLPDSFPRCTDFDTGDQFPADEPVSKV